jgi:hypothetical protein
MGKLFHAMTNTVLAGEYYLKAAETRRTFGGGYEGFAEEKLAAVLFDSAESLNATNRELCRSLLIRITNDPRLDATRYGDRARYRLERR